MPINLILQNGYITSLLTPPPQPKNIVKRQIWITEKEQNSSHH